MTIFRLSFKKLLSLVSDLIFDKICTQLFKNNRTIIEIVPIMQGVFLGQSHCPVASLNTRLRGLQNLQVLHLKVKEYISRIAPNLIYFYWIKTSFVRAILKNYGSYHIRNSFN